MKRKNDIDFLELGFCLLVALIIVVTFYHLLRNDSPSDSNIETYYSIVDSGRISDLEFNKDKNETLTVTFIIGDTFHKYTIPLEICQLVILPSQDRLNPTSQNLPPLDDALPRIILSGAETLYSVPLPEEMTFLKYYTITYDSKNPAGNKNISKVRRGYYGSRYVFFLSESWLLEHSAYKDFSELFALFG